MSSQDLVSVYTYDREYRKIQHQHKFRWSTAVSHLMVGHLRLKQTPPSQNGSKQKPKQEKPLPSGNFSSHTADGKVICKKFNNCSGCNFLNCKFEHVCNVPGCAKQHPGHTEIKKTAWHKTFTRPLSKAWEQELGDDLDKNFLLNGIKFGFDIVDVDSEPQPLN